MLYQRIIQIWDVDVLDSEQVASLGNILGKFTRKKEDLILVFIDMRVPGQKCRVRIGGLYVVPVSLCFCSENYHVRKLLLFSLSPCNYNLQNFNIVFKLVVLDVLDVV